MKDIVKELTFYMGDKTDEELWAIVRDACRVTTPAWRAYEKLHSLYREAKLRMNGIKLRRVGNPGTLTCEIWSNSDIGVASRDES